MKLSTVTVAALGLSTALGLSFDIPRGVHTMEALEEARAKAAERPEPVAFVITRVSLQET